MKLSNTSIAQGRMSSSFSRFFGDAPPRPARAFILTIVVAAVPVLAYSLYFSATRVNLNWLWLAALTIPATWHPVVMVSFSRAKVWISLSDVFVFMAILFFGPEAAAIVATVEAITFNIRKRKLVCAPYRFLFNVAQIAIVAFVAGHMFYLIGPAKVESPPALFLVAVGSGLYYYFLTSGLVARAVALSGGRPFAQVWRKSLTRVHIPLASALLSAFVFVCLK